MMKKILTSLVSVAVMAVYAGYDLPIDGKFSQRAQDLPTQWEISETGAARIVRGEELFSKALQLTAGKTAVRAASKYTFSLPPRAVLEVEAEIKGSGIAFIDVELINATGKVTKTHRIATQHATGKFTDIKGKFRFGMMRFTPVKARIVIGVEPGSTIAFDDVDAELDND